MVATKKTTKYKSLELFGTKPTKTANINITGMGPKILEKTVKKAY